MHFSTLLSITLSAGVLGAHTAVRKAQNGLVARATECQLAACKNGRKFNDDATETCCDEQIDGLLGLGLLFTNDNLETARTITPAGGFATYCLTKDNEKTKVNGDEFNICCLEQGGDDPKSTCD